MKNTLELLHTSTLGWFLWIGVNLGNPWDVSKIPVKLFGPYSYFGQMRCQSWQEVHAIAKVNSPKRMVSLFFPFLTCDAVFLSTISAFVVSSQGILALHPHHFVTIRLFYLDIYSTRIILCYTIGSFCFSMTLKFVSRSELTWLFCFKQLSTKLSFVVLLVTLTDILSWKLTRKNWESSW